MRLPEVPGQAVCRRLKGDPTTAAVPVIGVSAAMTRGEGLDAGCDWFLPKPFDLADLVALVRTALRPLAGASPRPAVAFGGGAREFRTALARSLAWHRAERAASRERLAAIRTSAATLLDRRQIKPRAA